jgi:hypothetical protein
MHFVEVDQLTDQVQAYQGTPLTQVPLPTVQQFADTNELQTFNDSEEYGSEYYDLLVAPGPFTIKIAGEIKTSTEYFTGRPPLRPR